MSIIQEIREEFGVNIELLLTGEGEPYPGETDKIVSREIMDPERVKDKENNDQPVGLGQAVKQLARILNSDNQLLINNILSNLQVSYDALESQKKDKDRIEQSEEELKKRISALEEKCERLIEEIKGLSPTFELSNIGSLMCVPMINDQSRIRGIFYIDSLDKPYGFRREDLTILTDLSKRAAMYIEHGMNAEPHPN